MLTFLKKFFNGEPKEGQYIAEFPIAGLQHYRGGELNELIKIGDTLTLKEEPENEHDKNAVMVLWHGNKFGYIPASIAREIRRHLHNGIEIIATVVNIKPDADRQFLTIRVSRVQEND